MRRWLFPILVGLLLAALAFQVTLALMPSVVMGVAVGRTARVTGGLNRMFHAPLPGPGRRTIVRPSPDLAYSICPFDLSKGPLLLEAAPVPAPYWSLSVFDRSTDVAFVRNNRDTSGRPIRVVLARAGQAVPDGVEAVRLKGDGGVALVRILVADRTRFGAVDRARRTSRCAPL